MLSRCITAIFVVSTLGFTNHSLAAEIVGTINFESKRRLNHNSEAELAVVFYRPAIEPNTTITSPELAPVEMKMSMKSFDPMVIAVQTGTEVNFPNADRVIHNAFSTNKKNQFDLGFYPQGEARSHVFEEAGLVKVFCNVHQSMFGYVMVLDTPYFTKANADGSFELTGLPEGLGKIFVWHPRGKTVSQIVQTEAQPIRVETTVTLTKRVVPKHKNKFGKPYRRNRDY